MKQEESPRKVEPSQKWPEWECRFEPLSKEQAETQVWTVGAPQLLVCDGDSIERVGPKAHIQFIKPNQKYALKILKVKVSETHQAQFIVTAYKPGHYKNVALNIVDGTHGFSVSSLNWEVASVIKKQALKPPAKTRMGPVALEIPMWYWAAWGSAALLALIVLGRWVYKKVSRRRRLAQLESFQTTLAPYHQYNKQIRKLKRQVFTDRSYQENDSEQLKNYVNQLDEEFRLYLVRDLKVPAQEWSSRQILAEVKAYHSYLDVEHRAQIKRVLFELEKVKNANFTISREDWDQLTVMSQSVVDSIAVALRKSQRRAGRQ